MRISDWSSDVCSSDLRLGVEVWPVHTVQFSNHTGYPDWQGEVFAAEQIARVLEGLEARGAFARCDALLTGYVGDPSLGAVILDAAARLRATNPQALWCCDPVMGDHGKRSEEHTSELQSLMRISYAVFCLK